MLSYQSSGINNKGYFDVPICNSLSNKEYRDKSQDIGQYELNQKINLTVNDNNADYTVYQKPTHPSSSLYIESDEPASPYYQQSYTKVDNYPPLLVKKKEYTHPSYDNGMIENFENASIYDGYNSGSCLGFSSVNNDGGIYVPNNIVERSKYVNHANKDYNQFLNIGSIPNASAYYINNMSGQGQGQMQGQQMQPRQVQMQQRQNIQENFGNMHEEQYERGERRNSNQFIVPTNKPQIDNRYNNQHSMHNLPQLQNDIQRYNRQPMMINNYMVAENDNTNRKIEYPKKIVVIDDEPQKIKVKKHSDKDGHKDKSSSVLFYITIILLCIVIIMLLFKSVKK